MSTHKRPSRPISCKGDIWLCSISQRCDLISGGGTCCRALGMQRYFHRRRLLNDEEQEATICYFPPPDSTSPPLNTISSTRARPPRHGRRWTWRDNDTHPLSGLIGAVCWPHWRESLSDEWRPQQRRPASMWPRVWQTPGETSAP